MLSIKVAVTGYSADRFWDPDKQFPPNLQIAVNINLAEFSQKGEDSAEVPFIMTVNYTPSVGQLMSKGRVYLSGDKKLVQDMREGMKKNQLPGVVVQAIWTATLGEISVISKSMGLPPPLPPIGQPQAPGESRDIQRFTV
jgi:hypothetical protein